MQIKSERRTLNFPAFDKAEYKECYVILIDIIGFGDLVKNNNFEKVHKILSALEKDVSNGEITIQTSEDEYQKAFKGKKYTGVKSFKPSVSIMSDTIVICIPEEAFLKTTKEMTKNDGTRLHSDNHMKLFTISTEISRFQITLLKEGSLSRGAIVYDKVYCKDSLCFGPAIIKAYKLGEKDNPYPRVVISDGLIDKLDVQNSKFVIKDKDDNKFYFDYLCWAHAQEPEDDFKTEIQKIIKLTKEEMNSSKISSDSNKLEKWKWLKCKAENKLSAISNS